MSERAVEAEDTVSPMIPQIPKRVKTNSDVSQFAEGEMMGSLVRQRRVRHSICNTVYMILPYQNTKMTPSHAFYTTRYIGSNDAVRRQNLFYSGSSYN